MDPMSDPVLDALRSKWESGARRSRRRLAMGFLLAGLVSAGIVALVVCRASPRSNVPPAPLRAPFSIDAGWSAPVIDFSDPVVQALREADALKGRGDLAGAEAVYLKLRASHPADDRVEAELRDLYKTVKLPQAGDDLEKKIGLLAWLQVVDLKDEARILARGILSLDPERTEAHQALDEVRFEGRWLSADEAEAARVATARGLDWTKMKVRERRVFALKLYYSKAFQNEGNVLLLDGFPNSPFYFCMETSETYCAELMLQQFADYGKNLFDEFQSRYGSLFQTAKVLEDQVCFVYVFRDRMRYANSTLAPYWFAGHFEMTSGNVFMYKDTQKLVETIFHLCTHQLVDAISSNRNPSGVATKASAMCWFSEGLSTYFEGFRHGADGSVILGALSTEYLPVVKRLMADPKRLRLDRLMRMSYDEFSRKKDDLNYHLTIGAQSWSVVYFLNTYEGGKYSTAFKDYFQAEVDGKGSYEAAKTAFGDLDALDKEYVKFFANLK